jgi:hypothetical protein
MKKKQEWFVAVGVWEVKNGRSEFVYWKYSSKKINTWKEVTKEMTKRKPKK